MEISPRASSAPRDASSPLRSTWSKPAARDQMTLLSPLLVAIAVVGLYAAIASPHFLAVANAQNIARQIAVLAVIAAGQTLLMIGGQLDLSVASGASLASVVGALLLTTTTTSPAVILLLVVTLMAVIGLATGLVVTATKVQPFILTLGLLSVLAAVARVLSNSRQIPSGLTYTNLVTDTVVGIPISAFLGLVMFVVLGAVLRYTAFGRFVFALGSNEHASYLSGVPTTRIVVALYTINGALVGLAGLLLIGRLAGGDPQAGAGLELQAITAVVLGGASLAGGRGSMFGTLLGVALIGLISNALNVAGVTHAYLQLIYGAVLMASVTYSASMTRIRSRRASQRLATQSDVA